MNIILYRPQIPQNTGNIARTCAVTGTKLTLVRPLGFSTTSRHLKRSGLDYWKDLSPEEIDDLPAYLAQSPTPVYFFSSKADRPYTDISFSPEDRLVFGSETDGLPDSFREMWPDAFYRIPMLPQARCINLAASAAIVLYEALRQTRALC